MLTLEHGPAWCGRGSTEIRSGDVWSKRAANIETQARPGLYVVYERGSAMVLLVTSDVAGDGGRQSR